MDIKTIFKEAKAIADKAAEAVTRHSNGSEAWQVVNIKADGRSKLGRQLKELNIRHDSYWGYLIGANMSNYFKEEAWTTAYAQTLAKHGIKASRVERLL